jgi:hypothetical protein
VRFIPLEAFNPHHFTEVEFRKKPLEAWKKDFRESNPHVIEIKVNNNYLNSFTDIKIHRSLGGGTRKRNFTFLENDIPYEVLVSSYLQGKWYYDNLPTKSYPKDFIMKFYFSDPEKAMIFKLTFAGV